MLRAIKNFHFHATTGTVYTYSARYKTTGAAVSWIAQVKDGTGIFHLYGVVFVADGPDWNAVAAVKEDVVRLINLI